MRSDFQSILDDQWSRRERARKRGGPVGRGRRCEHIRIHKATKNVFGVVEVPEMEGREVPCRSCGGSAELSGFGALIASKVNEILDVRGEEAQPDNELIFCPECAAKEAKRQEAEAQAIHDQALEIFKRHRDTGEPISAVGKNWLRKNGYRVPPEKSEKP